MQEINVGTAFTYGGDESSRVIHLMYSEIFEKEAFVVIMPTATFANRSKLAGISQSYGAIFCHQDAHIVNFMFGASEFYTTGALLVVVPRAHFQVGRETLLGDLGPDRGGDLHDLKASALSLTQVTDGWTVYILRELAKLSRITRNTGLKVYMDAPQIANTMAYLGCSASGMT